MFTGLTKRLEVYYETSSLFTTDAATSGPQTPDRVPSSQCRLRVVTAGGTVNPANLILTVNSVAETLVTNGSGTYWSTKEYTDLDAIDWDFGIGSIAINQMGVDRSPINQKVSRSKYVYGELVPTSGVEGNSLAGKLPIYDYRLDISPQHRDANVYLNDWVKDGDGDYYQVLSIRTEFPDGHKELGLKKAV